MMEYCPGRRRNNLQPCTRIGKSFTTIVWILNQAQKSTLHSIHEKSYARSVCAVRRQDSEHPFEGESVSGRRQEGEPQGSGLQNSISLLPPSPTGDQTQGPLYLDKSSMAKLYLQITLHVFETGSHYIAQSVPSLTSSCLSPLNC